MVAFFYHKFVASKKVTEAPEKINQATSKAINQVTWSNLVNAESKCLF
jgi:hypothetical protein